MASLINNFPHDGIVTINKNMCAMIEIADTQPCVSTYVFRLEGIVCHLRKVKAGIHREDRRKAGR